MKVTKELRMSIQYMHKSGEQWTVYGVYGGESGQGRVGSIQSGLWLWHDATLASCSVQPSSTCVHQRAVLPDTLLNVVHCNWGLVYAFHVLFLLAMVVIASYTIVYLFPLQHSIF